MKLLKEYFEIRKKIHEYFGYKEDWVVIPLDDCTEYYWILDEITDHTRPLTYGAGSVRFADNLEDLDDEEKGKYYENEIYTQRFLPKYVYETVDYTMICVDTQTDGNKFLAIFDNSKRVKENGSSYYFSLDEKIHKFHNYKKATSDMEDIL